MENQIVSEVELGEEVVTDVSAKKEWTPREILDKVFALTAFARHNQIRRSRPSKRHEARAQAAKARIAKRKAKR